MRVVRVERDYSWGKFAVSSSMSGSPATSASISSVPSSSEDISSSSRDWEMSMKFSGSGILLRARYGISLKAAIGRWKTVPSSSQMM